MAFQVRERTWDANIVREVVEGDCYRHADWNPPNPVTIVDVGAHIGGFSRWSAVRMPHARIVAIEMDPDNYEVARLNLAEFDNVELHHAALGDRDGLVNRKPVTTANTGGAEVTWDAPVDGDGLVVEALDVATLLTRVPGSYIDCLKLDCEGSEHRIVPALAALPGGLRARVGCLRAELHAEKWSDEYNAFLEILRDAFPFTSVGTAASHLHYAFGWR